MSESWDDHEIADLLAGLRDVEGPPADVAARLDATLADLSARRATAARRPRRVRLVLTAAAASAALIVGGNALLHQPSLGGSTASGGAADTERQSQSQPPSAATYDSATRQAAENIAKVRPGSLRRDVRKALSLYGRASSALTSGYGECTAPTARRGDLTLPVLYADQPATLVSSTRADGRHVVIWSCDAKAALARLTLKP